MMKYLGAPATTTTQIVAILEELWSYGLGGGEWKRRSKKKHGKGEVRKFEYTENGLVQYVYTENGILTGIHDEELS